MKIVFLRQPYNLALELVDPFLCRIVPLRKADECKGLCSKLAILMVGLDI